MEITYDYYRIFYYVATYKSFSRAADILMSNQPNISKFMSNLENQLGCKLFIRSNRGVSLTHEGGKLFRHVSIAYEQIRTAELELATDQSLSSGIITIGVSETALHGFLLPILGNFHNLHPKIRLCILNHSTPQAIQALKDGTVDFAVATTPTDVKKPLKETRLKTFQEILIGSSQYSFLATRPRHLCEILSYPLICLGKNTKTYEFYKRLFLKYNLILKPDTETATTGQLLPMIKNHLGIGFIPERFAMESIKSQEVYSIPLIEPIPRRGICLVEDSSRPLSIAANSLKLMLLSHISKYVDATEKDRHPKTPVQY
ncbi:LysR family transcriptional regulator [Clostridium sp. E02]|uniref:LysR family transcriptional regulator n=1 Tax=Clostridium sp. E02 TaxID=2487134 RepID=UPI000F53F3E1|nr:LysR family transcriptional regulator [Clostridium sp. E02]